MNIKELDALPSGSVVGTVDYAWRALKSSDGTFNMWFRTGSAHVYKSGSVNANRPIFVYENKENA